MQLRGYFSGKLRHPMLWLLRTALWLLSTWYGTFILCGIKSLSSQFPYFQRFSQVEAKRREEILVNWSTSYFYHLKMLFRAMKFLVHLVFFTQVCMLVWVKILINRTILILCNVWTIQSIEYVTYNLCPTWSQNKQNYYVKIFTMLFKDLLILTQQRTFHESIY